MTQTCMYILSAVCLFLDIVGAYLIFKGSDLMNLTVAEMTEKVANTIGFWQDNPIDQSFFENLTKARHKSNWMNKWGIRLLIAGFFGQFIIAVYFANNS